MMTFALIISGLFNIVVGFALVNALRKLEIYEQFCESLQVGLITILQEMKNIDIRGSFEADDEVGIVFKILHKMIERLNAFLDEDTDGA